MAKERSNPPIDTAKTAEAVAPVVENSTLTPKELRLRRYQHAMHVTKFGDDVAYYEQGDPQQEPLVAKVTRITPTGMTLHVFTLRGMTVKDYTRHIDDPWFDEVEQRQRTLREKGAWATLEEAQDRLNAQAAARRAMVLKQQAAEVADRQALIDEQPLLEAVAMAAEQLARDGVPLPEMVTRLGQGVTIGQLKQHFASHPVSA